MDDPLSSGTDEKKNNNASGRERGAAIDTVSWHNPMPPSGRINLNDYYMVVMPISLAGGDRSFGIVF